jgi:hypothetical protein
MDNKKQVSFRIESNIIKQIKFLAVEQDKPLTVLFYEALQDLMNKYGKKIDG